MSGRRQEDEFETYLRERSVLPGGLPAAQQIEPPRDLDERVLSQARQAIHAPPLRLSRAPRWAWPVALAATLLLSFSIILNVSLTTRKLQQDTPAASTLQATEARAPATAGTPATRDAPVSPTAPEASTPPAPSASSSLAYAPASASALKGRPVPEARELAPRADASAAPAPRTAATLSRAFQDPQAWLRRIEALRAQGKTAAADAELRRFREAFPHYPVPPPPPAASDPAK